MPFAYEKLKGLDRERLLEAIEPVLRAHGLDGVEMIWRTDNRGWVLYVTVERPGTTDAGAGVTLDDCTELSRDLSTALDVADVISNAYRLEVGSPGLERNLYQLADYQRFAGQTARVKCREEVLGQRLLRGALNGVDDAARVLMRTDHGDVALGFEMIESGQLVLQLAKSEKKKPTKRRSQNGK
jgi:ribosome maturation factor RimP